jgi:hypothetical protein
MASDLVAYAVFIVSGFGVVALAFSLVSILEFLGRIVTFKKR